MGEFEVKFYGTWNNPFSPRVEVALKLKGIQYLPLHKDSPELLAVNPIYKTIPVLFHNDKPISDSQVILEYIDQTWPDDHPLLPQNPYDRAKARFWAKFMDDKCYPSFLKVRLSSSVNERETAFQEIEEHLGLLEKELFKDNKLLGGERIGFLDIVANLVGYYLAPIEEVGEKKVLIKEKFPCLFNWAQDYSSHEIIKETHPPIDEVVEYFRPRT